MEVEFNLVLKILLVAMRMHEVALSVVSCSEVGRTLADDEFSILQSDSDQAPVDGRQSRFDQDLHPPAIGIYTMYSPSAMPNISSKGDLSRPFTRCLVSSLNRCPGCKGGLYFRWYVSLSLSSHEVPLRNITYFFMVYRCCTWHH